jgi:hypothetical protein
MPLRRMSLVVVVALTGCDRPASIRGDRPVTIDDLRISKTDSSRLLFQYRTPTPTADCKAQEMELPKVWDLVVKSHLSDHSDQPIVLFPEDRSGQSVSFEFTKTASGWSSEGPCPTTIPAN